MQLKVFNIRSNTILQQYFKNKSFLNSKSAFEKMANRISQKIDGLDDEIQYSQLSQLKDQSISSNNGAFAFHQAGTIDMQADQTIFSNMSKDVQLRQGTREQSTTQADIKIARRPGAGGMQSANFSRRIQPGTSSPDSPRKIGKQLSSPNKSASPQKTEKSKSFFEKNPITVEQDQVLDNICFKDFDQNFQKLHKVKDIIVAGQMDNIAIQENQMAYRKATTRAFTKDEKSNVVTKKTVHVDKATRTPEWVAQNKRNLPALKEGLERAKAFDIEYASEKLGGGLIQKTKLLSGDEMANLKKLNEVMWVPTESGAEKKGEFVNTPAKDMFDKVIGGTPVPKIQQDQEKKLCKNFLNHVGKAKGTCLCVDLDKQEGRPEPEEPRDHCNCLCYYKKTNKSTHAMVELAQATLPDEGMGIEHRLFVVQKIADYENFDEEIRLGDDEEDEGLGRGGKHLIRFFELGDDLQLSMVKKIIINDQVNYQFHPNVITTYQVGNEIYFYQIMTDCIKMDKQRVILRSFNLATLQLQIYDGDNSCEIPIDQERGPLLSVSFLKKKEHVTEAIPKNRNFQMYSDDEEPVECSLVSQPVLLIYQTMAVVKKKSRVFIEFRDSDKMHDKPLYADKVDLESFSKTSPISFFEQPKEGNLEIDRDCLYFEGRLFYKYQLFKDDSHKDYYWKIEKPKIDPPGTTMEQIEVLANLIKQEEQVRNTEQGNNQGTLFYYESDSNYRLTEQIQSQKQRQFFENCVAIFNQLEEWSLVVQQKNSETLRYTISLVGSSVKPPKSQLQLKGQNRLFASIQQQDLEFGFDQHHLQIVIPRQLSNVQSYFFDGHNILVYHTGQVHHIREKLKELDIASKFQTPILKYFYAYESDIVAENRLKPAFKKQREQHMAAKGIEPFSQKIAHFDGLYLENKESMIEKKVHQLIVITSTDKDTCLEVREPQSQKKDKPAHDTKEHSKIRASRSIAEDPSNRQPLASLVQAQSLIKLPDGQENQEEVKEAITDSSQFLVVTEKVIFTHDDRSVRPIILVDTDGDISLDTEINQVFIALYDFQNMKFSETKIDNKLMQDVYFRNLIQLDLSFQPCIASYKSVAKQFILCPSSEISYELIDEKRVRFTQHYQMLSYCTQYNKTMEIQEFQIEWMNTRASPEPVYARIRLLGIKYFMIQLKESKLKQVEFMPLLGYKDDDEVKDLNQIQGTQIMILCEGDENKVVYEIKQKEHNSLDKDKKFKYDKQPYTWANSEIYGGKYQAYIFEAQLTPLVLKDYRMFDQEELYQILKETLKVVGNLVPYDATLALSRKSSQRDDTQGYGYMSALEILDGQTTISLYCAKPDSIEKALDSVSHAQQKKDMFCMSHFERFCRDDQPLRKFLEEEKNLKYSGLSVEQTKGIDLQPILERLIQLEGQTQSLKILTKHIFQNERTEQAQRMLMRYFELMVKQGKLKHLPDFIENKYDGTPLAVNLEIPVESAILEKYGASELQVFPEQYQGSRTKMYDNTLSKMEDYDVDQCVAGDIKIDHTYIDFRPLIFQRKLDYLLMEDGDRTLADIEMSWLGVSEICNYILENDEDIEKKQVIKNLIDYIFVEFSVNFFIMLNILYIFTLGCFIWQILVDADIDNGHHQVFFCMVVFAFTQLIFFYMELIEMSHNPMEYVLNPWNKIDLPIFFFSMYYVYERMYHLEMNYSPKSPRPSIDADNYVWMIILNGIIIAMGFFKIMFFFRVYDSFGQFVQLMSTVVKDMSIFLVFMFMIILTFSFLFTIVGAEFSSEDYPGLGSQMIYFIQIFRNSMGDLAVPGYEKWIKYIEYQETINSGMDYVFGGYFMIFLIWTLWLFNIVLALIILLNFLIAIISQSYEQVMAQQILNRYKHRCEINRECLIIRGHFFFLQTPHFNSLIIYSKNMTDADGNWEGMVSNIKIFMRDQTEIIKEHIIKQTQKVEALIKGENNTLKEHQEKMKVEVRERNAQVKDEIRDKIRNCEKTVADSKNEIDKKVYQCMGELKEEISQAQKVQDDKMFVIKRDLGVLKKLLVESIYDIKDNVQVVHNDLKTTGEKHIEIQEMQSSFIEKIKMQQNNTNMFSSRSQSQESPRQKRGVENKLANTRSQAKNIINEVDQQDSLMEASSINKLGAPELEVVQEYRKKNPKKFTMGKHSSAVPGRRLRSKDIGAGGGFTESMANTMPEGFSQANAFDTSSAEKFDPGIATGEIVIKDQLQITASVLGGASSKKPTPFKSNTKGPTRKQSPNRQQSPRKVSPRRTQTSKPKILTKKENGQTKSSLPQSSATNRVRKTSPKIKKSLQKKKDNDDEEEEKTE